MMTSLAYSMILFCSSVFITGSSNPVQNSTTAFDLSTSPSPEKYAVEMLPNEMNFTSFKANANFTEATLVEDNLLVTMGQNNVTLAGVSEEQPMWSVIIDDAQIAMTTVGFIANTVAYLTLRTSGKYFGETIRLILMNQGILDALVCLSGALLLVFPPMWMTGLKYLDIAICHTWHSQIVFWFFVSLSIYNLILVAVDRFLATCHSLKYASFSKGKVHRSFAVLFVIATIDAAGVVFQVRYADGACLSEYAFSGKAIEVYFATWAIVLWFTVYGIPTFILICLYGKVIYAFKQRQNQGNLAHSRVIENATREITKTAIIVTAIFIVSIGFDLNYYVLGYIGVLEYVFGSPLQKVAVLLSAFNSVANPFVYALLMPIFRQRLRKLFICSRKKPEADGRQVKSSSSCTTIA